jgi:hypothetical protein
MFEEPLPGGTVSAESANAPNLSYTATPIFGNMNFTITVPQTKGKVENAFPVMSYLSIESLIFFQNMSNPNTNPTAILAGSNTGQQVTSGTLTQKDATGIPRVSTGNSLSVAT